MRIPAKLALVPATALAAALLAPVAGAAEGGGTYNVTVTIENLAPEAGTLQTPFWVALHDGGFDTYDRDAPASAALERLAEDGNTMPITEAFAASGGGVDGTVAGPDGPIPPGGSATMTFQVDPSTSKYLSYASMVIPSNDAFVSNGNPMAHQLFDDDGMFVGESFVIAGSDVLDAGTEVNDEVPANTAALAQMAPDTGDTENGVVTLHGGFDPAGNILAARAGADFSATDYQIARISVSAFPVVADHDVVAYSHGDFEVPRVGSDAWAWSVFRIRDGGATIEYSTTTFGLAEFQAVHLHHAAPGSNGGVVVNLTPHIVSADATQGRVAGTITADMLTGDLAGMSMGDLISAIGNGGIYINFHTTANPGGEIRGNLVGA